MRTFNAKWFDKKLTWNWNSGSIQSWFIFKSELKPQCMKNCNFIRALQHLYYSIKCTVMICEIHENQRLDRMRGCSPKHQWFSKKSDTVWEKWRQICFVLLFAFLFGWRKINHYIKSRYLFTLWSRWTWRQTYTKRTFSAWNVALHANHNTNRRIMSPPLLKPSRAKLLRNWSKNRQCVTTIKW